MTRNELLEAIMTLGHVDRDAAEHVVNVYKSHRLVTYNAHDGYRLKDGACLDAEVIARVAVRH